ncbi:MAG: hypothetical protein N2Z21_04505, partial [Candidatus Sumerlaeaceae bacterium]|nr:hypothetical protein [Candidatus Sumerlaeaceae bacterium]
MATHSFYMIIAACALAICGVSVGRVLISPLINFVQRQGKEIWVSETLALSAALGISVIVIFGLLLGYIGAFSLWSLLLLLFAALAASTYLYPKLMKHLTWGKVGRGDLAVLVICLALIGYAVFMRGHEIQGMRDQGVYTCTGIQLARTGTFIWHDRLITLLGFESVKHLFEDIGDILQGRPRFLRFAGYYLCPPQTGRVVPQFLHGYEVWVAVAYLVGGPQATQCLNGAFAALGVLLFYCVVRRVASPRTALISAFLLATSLPQLWYSRFPSNEPLLQVLVWATILGYVLLSVGQAPLSQRAQETRQFFLFPLAIPLAVATTVKFAFWPSLTIFAFEGGLRAHKRSSCLNAMLLWLIFVTV